MPSMGGSATLISAPRYGDLTNVDTTGQADHQIFAWDATAGKYKPLTGVAGDGNGGVNVIGGVTALQPDGNYANYGNGGFDIEPVAFDASLLLGGRLVIEDAPGMEAFVYQLFLQQTATLTADTNLTAIDITRASDLAGHDYLNPVIAVHDTTACTAPVLRLTKSGGTVLAARTNDGTIHGRLSGEGVLTLDGGVGLFGTAAPGAKPAITGALSTVADAPAKAVLTSIIAALVGCGLASNGTT